MSSVHSPKSESASQKSSNHQISAGQKNYNQKADSIYSGDSKGPANGASRLPKIENFAKNAKSEFDGYNPPMPARTRVLQIKNDLQPVRTHMPAPPITESRKKGVKIDKTNSVKSGGFK